ncbi:uncharacterized protein STEHIDRAFT_157700 [Stereum hirsutum FP-91666 SS1]|uniref:uncharacterized protein n=1 Tax=Stereum hirsutum (strain FP-91666) TaxID=721885 RepID=UPI00044492E7|nr:uncharacterized protein STEHIDRAFT_157700 [Stereum hirsutum FP-91666 SS1]EIM86196.1 hypothetical protein STEHIDRAFT_157700 [Stereum hirsutum FP-91666 SS1]
MLAALLLFLLSLVIVANLSPSPVYDSSIGGARDFDTEPDEGGDESQGLDLFDAVKVAVAVVCVVIIFVTGFLLWKCGWRSMARAVCGLSSGMSDASSLEDQALTKVYSTGLFRYLTGMLRLVLAARREYRSNIVGALDCLCDYLDAMEPVGVVVQSSSITQSVEQALPFDISFGGPGHNAGEDRPQAHTPFIEVASIIELFLYRFMCEAPPQLMASNSHH